MSNRTIERSTPYPTILKEIRIFSKGSNIAYGYTFGKADYIGTNPELLKKGRINDFIELLNNTYGEDISLVNKDLGILDFVTHISPSSFNFAKRTGIAENSIQVACVIDTFESLDSMDEKGLMARGTPKALEFELDSGDENKSQKKRKMKRDALMFSKSAWELMELLNDSHGMKIQ